MTSPSNILRKREEVAEQLHVWYLEATKQLNPESYNPNAQKSYQDLTEDQKNIDRFIAKKVIDSNRQTVKEVLEGVREEIEKMKVGCSCGRPNIGNGGGKRCLCGAEDNDLTLNEVKTLLSSEIDKISKPLIEKE